jgi:hypothetical protein
MLSAIIIANPIDTSPTIYELQILEPDNWFIEINMENYYLDDLDSIFVECINGKEKVEYFDTTSVDSQNVIVISPSNMSNELLISRDSDFVRLYFNDVTSYYKEVCFGNFPGSGIHNITADQSIVYHISQGYYCKSDSPTIGQREHGNSTGTIYGHFYDKDGSPIRDRYAVLRHGDFMVLSSDYIDSTGYYTSVLPAYYHFYDYLVLWKNSIENSDGWNFEPVSIDVEPGDSLLVDFYASQTAIKPVIKNDIIKLNNYPHPASSYTWFYIDNTDVDASAMRVNVYALNGRKVDSFIPTARHFRYDCGHLPQGSYVLTLNHGHEMLASKKLQILK